MSETAKQATTGDNHLKLPKIPQKFLTKFAAKQRAETPRPLPSADKSDGSSPNSPPIPAEVSYILIVVRDLWLAVRRIAFLICLIQDFNSVSVLHGAHALAEKLTGVHQHFQYFNERLLGGAANGSDPLSDPPTLRARKILRQFHQRYPDNDDLYVTFCVMRRHQGRCLTALADRLTSYRQLLAAELRSTKAEDRNRTLRLERSRIAIVKYEAAVDGSQAEIENTRKARNEQIYRKCDQISQLKFDLENVVALQTKFVGKIRSEKSSAIIKRNFMRPKMTSGCYCLLQKLFEIRIDLDRIRENYSQEQIEEIQRIQNQKLQQEWFMHRRIREFSVEMKALSRANSDTEFLLRQRSNNSDEVVADLRRQYEKSLGLSDASLMETEFALQEEVRLLERFRDKVQKLQEEWEEVMRRREEEEERRKLRTAKIKKRFHLLIKTLAYFRREKQPPGEKEADAESATRASPKSPKKHKKLGSKKSR